MFSKTMKYKLNKLTLAIKQAWNKNHCSGNQLTLPVCEISDLSYLAGDQI